MRSSRIAEMILIAMIGVGPFLTVESRSTVQFVPGKGCDIDMPPHPSAFADCLILTGPTGSGKSAVALELAERGGYEIVAMDSMTLYRGLDIGTAKPTPAEQARIPHHLIDVLAPSEAGNVAWWLEQAALACATIRNRGHRPLFVGGTPFYLKALLCGLFDAPPTDPALRRQLEQEAEAIGPLAFHERLRLVDPKSADRLHPNDVRRVVRAREVHALTGRPLSDFQQTWDSPTFGHASPPPQSHLLGYVLEWPRDVLYRRIEARVDAMLAAGWLEEVRQLRDRQPPLSSEAAQALGYRELLAYLDHPQADWSETVQTIKTRTRQFAKRQLTWFRSLPQCIPISATQPDIVDQLLRVGGQTF
ncbi:MAG: tRNA (adenosine(37)-N6)-dimethylallyltransferase MiaA [Bacteroidales bacterium]|nr:tRNA (adenosine(37)-N6)-dimethylallyltransferase MiaA [Bacteroidales bacterium]